MQNNKRKKYREMVHDKGMLKGTVFDGSLTGSIFYFAEFQYDEIVHRGKHDA